MPRFLDPAEHSDDRRSSRYRSDSFWVKCTTSCPMRASIYGTCHIIMSAQTVSRPLRPRLHLCRYQDVPRTHVATAPHIHPCPAAWVTMISLAHHKSAEVRQVPNLHAAVFIGSCHCAAVRACCQCRDCGHLPWCRAPPVQCSQAAGRGVIVHGCCCGDGARACCCSVCCIAAGRAPAALAAAGGGHIVQVTGCALLAVPVSIVVTKHAMRLYQRPKTLQGEGWRRCGGGCRQQQSSPYPSMQEPLCCTVHGHYIHMRTSTAQTTLEDSMTNLFDTEI